MNNRPTFIGLIPARKGSKGLLNKNMLHLNNQPLVQYTIRAAMDSSLLEEVSVSSDDLSVLTLAESLQANTLLRPEEFSSDEASAEEVVNHFIATLSKSIDYEDHYIVYLQPTSPLRNSFHIDKAINILLENNSKSLTSVTQMRKSPFKSFVLSESGQLQSLFDEKMSNARRQDLQDVFIPNGAIYIFSIQQFIDRKGFPSNGSLPFIMSEDDSIDIDEKEDLLRAEKLLRIQDA
jgi:CMP-N,N'-diacetyllegionaminic acid synthase